MKTAKPDFRLLLVDETEHWCEDIRNRAGRLFGVYIFDFNRHVHLCDISPSYECFFITTVFSNDIKDNIEYENLFDTIEEANREERVTYFNCRDIKKYQYAKYELPKDDWKELLEDNSSKEAYMLAADMMIESYRTNEPNWTKIMKRILNKEKVKSVK